MDTPEGRVGACPKSVRDQGVTLVSTWDFQEGGSFQPRCGLRPPPFSRELSMNFYNQPHQFYCGIDLHARLLAVCVLDQAGQVVCQTQIPADKQLLLDTLAPFRTDVVVCVECLFAWYWVADLCHEHQIPFVLGHALYMKAIHGGKTKALDLCRHLHLAIPRLPARSPPT